LVILLSKSLKTRVDNAIGGGTCEDGEKVYGHTEGRIRIQSQGTERRRRKRWGLRLTKEVSISRTGWKEQLFPSRVGNELGDRVKERELGGKIKPRHTGSLIGNQSICRVALWDCPR